MLWRLPKLEVPFAGDKSQLAGVLFRVGNHVLISIEGFYDVISKNTLQICYSLDVPLMIKGKRLRSNNRGLGVAVFARLPDLCGNGSEKLSRPQHESVKARDKRFDGSRGSEDGYEVCRINMRRG